VGATPLLEEGGLGSAFAEGGGAAIMEAGADVIIPAIQNELLRRSQTGMQTGPSATPVPANVPTDPESSASSSSSEDVPLRRERKES
jgi:hypothetical protein